MRSTLECRTVPAQRITALMSVAPGSADGTEEKGGPSGWDGWVGGEGPKVHGASHMSNAGRAF